MIECWENQSELSYMNRREGVANFNNSLINVKTIVHYKRMLLYSNTRTLLAKSV